MNNKGVPCESCRVELVKENEDAAGVYMATRGQTLSIFNGERIITMDINHLAVWAMIDAYGIKDRVGCFEKVCRVFHQVEADRRNEEG